MSDSLPGVAIAISLVPPLTVVGIAYSQGDWDSGNGALLLFTTNMLAILVMGGLTFVITGVTPISRVATGQHRVRTAVAGVVVLGALVLGSLFLNGAQAATNLFDLGTTEDAVDEWLADDDSHRIVSVSIEDDTVVAVVVGPSDGLPTPADLAAMLSDRLGRTITADVRLIVEERIVATGG